MDTRPDPAPLKHRPFIVSYVDGLLQGFGIATALYIVVTLIRSFSP